MGMPHLSVGVPSQCIQVSIPYARVGEPMARVSKMARGKISLARGIQCCPIFSLFLFPDQRLYIVQNMRGDCI